MLIQSDTGNHPQENVGNVQESEAREGEGKERKYGRKELAGGFISQSKAID
jgi:hypothetical protein